MRGYCPPVENSEGPCVEIRSTLVDDRPIKGAAIVVDTFRAFSTAAYAFAQGVESIYLTDSVPVALDLAATRGYRTMGEVGGRKPDGFDLGNSPWAVTQRDDLRGVTVVHRSSAGTRGALHALRLGADPVFVSSLVVATATARLVGDHEAITIVACGLGGAEPADEDEVTASFIAARIRRDVVDVRALVEQVTTGRGAMRLRAAAWSPLGDVERCVDVDRFDFAMRLSTDDIGVRVDVVR
jgi:2-phosphosulfolactate phosphatase